MMSWVTAELTDDDRKYWFKKHYCPHCKKATTFMRCDNCSKFYCQDRNHAIWEDDSTWEVPNQPEYSVCYHCMPECYK